MTAYRQAFSNIKILESHSALKPIFSGLEQVCSRDEHGSVLGA